MAKLPRYMDIKINPNGREPPIEYNLIIKKWGIPHPVCKTLRRRCEIKWYQWLTLYPRLCIKMMCGDNDV